jgi:hypothetical protein
MICGWNVQGDIASLSFKAEKKSIGLFRPSHLKFYFSVSILEEQKVFSSGVTDFIGPELPRHQSQWQTVEWYLSGLSDLAS